MNWESSWSRDRRERDQKMIPTTGCGPCLVRKKRSSNPSRPTVVDPGLASSANTWSPITEGRLPSCCP